GRMATASVSPRRSPATSKTKAPDASTVAPTALPQLYAGASEIAPPAAGANEALVSAQAISVEPGTDTVLGAGTSFRGPPTVAVPRSKTSAAYALGWSADGPPWMRRPPPATSAPWGSPRLPTPPMPTSAVGRPTFHQPCREGE